MRRSSIVSLCLLASAVSLSSCKKGKQAPESEKAATPAQAPADPHKEEPKDPPKAEAKAEPKKAEVDDAKNCIAALEPASSFIPGTLVALPKPAGFEPTRHYPGFEENSGKKPASVIISEFPLPYPAAKNALSAESMWGRQEMQLVSAKESEFTANGTTCKGTLLEVVKNGDDAVHKFVWVFGDKKHSFQVMGACPEPCSEAKVANLKKIVTSARWNPERRSRRWDGLTFSLNPAPLRPLDGPMVSGYRRTYTSTGEQDPKGVLNVLRITSSVTPADEETKAFAEKAMGRLPIKNLKIESTRKAKSVLTGLKGWTFDATGATRTGAEQWLTYTMYFDSKTYWTLLGMCPIAEKKTCKEQFKRIMHSFIIHKPI